MSASVDTDTVLEIVIALAFLYFLLSLICSAINEAIASGLKWRAKDLKLGVINLLGEARADEFYADPRIQTLGKVKVLRWWQKLWKRLTKAWNPQANRIGYEVDGTSKLAAKPPNTKKDYRLRDPSYVSPRTFARVALDLYSKDDPQTLKRAGFSEKKATKLAEALGQSQVNREGPIPQSQPEAERSSLLGAAIRNVKAEAHEEVLALQASFEQEFNGLMERVSGWYKRKSIIWIAVIAVVVAGALNADTFSIVQRLADNPEMLSKVNEGAAEVVDNNQNDATDTSIAEAELGGSTPAEGAADSLDQVKASADGARQSGLPLGWSRAPWDEQDWDLGWAIVKVAGLIFTAAAITLGAPFWFEALGRLVPLRSTGKKPEAGS